MAASKYLAIYLNDHLAGSTGGLELVKRIAKQNEGNDLGRFAAGLRPELAQDRESLRAMMRELGVREDPVKTAGGWAAEKIGRLKLNGELRGYSPLSPLVELEGLMLGIDGKRRMWVAFAETDALADRLGRERLQELIARADRQRDAVEQQRLSAARTALVA
jgi:hypothetical protein